MLGITHPENAKSFGHFGKFAKKLFYRVELVCPRFNILCIKPVKPLLYDSDFSALLCCFINVDPRKVYKEQGLRVAQAAVTERWP